MKNYRDLYAESPRGFLSKLEEDIKGIEARLAKLDKLATDGITDLLTEYERLSLLVEQRVYGVDQAQDWKWTPDGSENVANLYPVEWLDDGRAFRWSGPQPITEFLVYIARDVPLRLRITLMKAFEPAILDALQVSVDGTVVKHPVGALQIVATVAPRMPLSTRPTRITLSTGSTASPGGADTRRLGIALFGIELTPAGAEDAHE